MSSICSCKCSCVHYIYNLTVRKLDSGTAPPRSEIEARILSEPCKRSHEQLDTSLAWVKGHKGIEGNEKADKLCREASILGHESEGVVTPAGLRAWSKRVRAEARGGPGEGILGTARQYRPTPGVSRRKDHSGSGYIG